MSISKICPVCSKEFSVPECRALTAKACSQKCRGVLIAKDYEAKRIEHKCKQCGKSFKSPKCQGERVYCSRGCAADSQDGVITNHSDGYILERSVRHPFNVSGYVLQHRLVMESWMREIVPDHQFLIDINGVKHLRRDINVHHKNEVKNDNQRENLISCTSSAHRDIHDGRPIMQGTVWPQRGDEIAAVARRVKTTCKECGSQIQPTLCDVKRGGGKFCSKGCAAKWNGNAKKNKIKRKCVECGTEFEACPSHIARGRSKFCSNSCRHKSRIGRNPKDVIEYP